MVYLIFVCLGGGGLFDQFGPIGLCPFYHGCFRLLSGQAILFAQGVDEKGVAEKIRGTVDDLVGFRIDFSLSCYALARN